MRKIIIAGNWKMNKDLAETRSFISIAGLAQREMELGHAIAIAAATYSFLDEAIQLAESTHLNACTQDVSANNDDSAFTRKVSALISMANL